jgi:hypothetical protein
MKGKIVLPLCLLLLSITTSALLKPAQAAPYYVQYAWVNPTYTGEDSTYGGSIIGYVAGSNWNITLAYTHYDPNPINISAIRVYFDWGTNYTYRFDPPVQIQEGYTQTFNVFNVTPSTTEATDLWKHDYSIYIDNVNNGTAPYVDLDSIPLGGGSNFVVLSADHLACVNLAYKLEMIFGSYSYLPYVNITKVQILMSQAYMEYTQGLALLSAKDFANAKTHLQQAESLYNDAITTWDEKGTAFEDAQLNLTIAQANYNNAEADASRKQADASLVNAYGWLLFGLGWTFIGIGIVIYGFRRPKTAPS